MYAPLYYGYGTKDSGASRRSGEGQRTKMARAVETELMRIAPDSGGLGSPHPVAVSQSDGMTAA